MRPALTSTTTAASEDPLSSAQPMVSVITVTWNAKAYVEECLGSLVAQQGSFPIEFIVVDNASSDGTPEMIEERFPSIRLVRNTANQGFAKANNIGIGLSRGHYICLINSDVTAPATCLANMYSYLSQRPDIGLLGPCMLGPNGKPARSCMRFPTLRAYLCYSLGLDLISREKFPFSGILMRTCTWDKTEEVDVLNGWFLMAPRVAVQEVGLLDERFFMYGEDIDWSYRFYKAGWKRMYYAGAQALHYGGASSAKQPIRFYLEMVRANLQFWRKYHGSISTLAYATAVGAHEVVRLLTYAAQLPACPARRPEVKAKIRRSLACLQWLIGARPPKTQF